MSEDGKCPVTGESMNPIASGRNSNRDWWPNQLNLRVLHQHSATRSQRQALLVLVARRSR
jgi:catalase-peroxidase